jgi:CRISPR-associated exonuclease Cas4
LYGIADVVEIKFNGNKDNSGLLQYRNEDFILTPVEYKRGKPKPDERDEVQLCAQAMCIEEMYSKIVEMGFLYYGETRHRHEVTFTKDLRRIVESYALRMHELFSKGITPLPEYKAHCRSCSLKETCLPKALSNKTSVSGYLKEIFTE